MALLAWKLDGRGGTIVDDVVEHRGIDSVRRDYRTIKEGGRNSKYTTIAAIQRYNKANTKQRGSNAVLGDLLRAGIYPVMIRQYRLITGQMIRRGKVPCLQGWRHLTDMSIVYTCSLFHSQQLSYTEHFHPESFIGSGRLTHRWTGGKCSTFGMFDGGWAYG